MLLELQTDTLKQGINYEFAVAVLLSVAVVEPHVVETRSPCKGATIMTTTTG